MKHPLKIREIGLAALFFCGITALYFYPQASTLSTALIGPPEDNFQQYWYLWHGVEALLHPDKPLMSTQMIYYPGGIGLFYISYYYWSFWMALLLKPFLNYVAIYNFLVLHSFVIGGAGAYVLARYLGCNRRASLVAGFVFAFSPNHFGRSLHHVHVATTYFAPIFFLFFLKSARESKFSHKILAGLLLAAWGFCDWAYLIYGILFLFLSYLYYAGKSRKVFPRQGAPIAIILAVAVLTVLPLAAPMALLGTKGTFKITYTGHDIYVADLLGFMIPHFQHLLSGTEWVRHWNDLMTGTYWEKAVYLGAVNLILITVAWPKLAKEQRKFLWPLLVFYVFAMGSHVHVLGKTLPIVLPYRIIEALPFFTNARNPARIIVWVYLFLSVLTAFSVQALLLKGRKSALEKIGVLAVILMLFLDYYSVAQAKTPIHLPGCYRVPAQDSSGDFGILELPYEGARYQAYQTLHGIPIVQGYVNRRFEAALADTIPFDPGRLAEQKKILIEKKVKYVVISKKRLDFDPEKRSDQIYRLKVQKISDLYGSVYRKVYEDESATTYQVYE